MCTRAEGEAIRRAYLKYENGRLIDPEDDDILTILSDAHRIEFRYTKDGIFAQAVRLRSRMPHLAWPSSGRTVPAVER